MGSFLRVHDRLCLTVIHVLLRVAVAVENYRRRLPRRVRRWRGSLSKLYRRWLERHGVFQQPFVPRRPCPWNRTPDHVEEKVVRLHVEQPHLGAGGLRMLAARVIGFDAARETFRRILMRRRDLVVALEEQRRKLPRRIRVSRPRELWGADLMLVLILGFFPVWIVGVVDYRGSRIVAFERVAWPTSASVGRVLANAFERLGAPARLLTDRAPIFTAEPVVTLLTAYGIRHVRIRPAHAWTNGRIERLFRIFRQEVLSRFWLVASLRQIDRLCVDFRHWHNRDRPHGSYDGRTPDEVHFDRPRQRTPFGRVTYFDGRLKWYRFG